MTSAALNLGPIAKRLVERDRAQQRVQQRGYHAVYRLGEVNVCPGCRRTQWLVGRQLAECAVCETALPIEVGGSSGPGLFNHGARTAGQRAALTDPGKEI